MLDEKNQENKVSPYDDIPVKNTEDTNTQEVIVDTTLDEPIVDEPPKPIVVEHEDKPIEVKPAVDTTLADTEESDEQLWEANTLTEKEATAIRAPNTLIPNIKEKQVITNTNEEDVIFTVRGTAKSVYAALETYLNQIKDDELDDENRIKWLTQVQNAQQNFMLANDQLFEATIRSGSSWVNMLNYGTPEEPKYKGMVSDRKGFNPRDRNDTASMGLVKALSNLGLGVPNYVPLYHTGIWVRLRTPSAAAFINLDEQMTMEKARYGALTRGEIFSNESVIIRKHVVNFILDHIEWTNAPQQDRDYLKSIIKVLDLDALMLGIMQNRYPDGYAFAQTCTVDPRNCTHTVEGKIDLRELRWDDESSLTPKQKQLMNNPRRAISEEELKLYQDEFRQNTKSRIVIDGKSGILTSLEEEQIVNGIALNIEAPSLEKDEDYGVQWINELVANAENIFREKHSEEDRRKRMDEEVMVSYFKTYGAWVESIEIYEAGKVITVMREEAELDTIFSHLSSDVRYVETYRRLIREYITRNIVTVIGIMNYECPNCGKKHDTPEGKFHIVLPIDCLYTFFILVRSSVRRSFLTSNI